MLSRQEILEVLGEAMEINSANLTEETPLEALGDAWDSVSRLSVISMIDSYANRDIPVNAIVESKTIKDLINLITTSDNQIISSQAMIKENDVLNRNKEEIVQIIKKSLKEVAEKSNLNLPENIDDETRILGGNSPFDSMQVVNLIVIVEEEITDRFNLDIILANEHTMSQSSSPFKTISTLADYIVGYLP